MMEGSFRFKATITIAVVWFAFVCQSHGAQGLGELELKGINKTPVKTLQMGDDLYDCIDFYQQPALDHPLLKIHKIQMKPTHQPEQVTNRTPGHGKPTNAMLRRVNCPPRTVPIWRNQNKNLPRLKHFSETFDTSIHPFTTKSPGEHVVALEPTGNSTYYGVHAIMNVYDLHLKSDQYTTTQMWIENGHLEDYTSVQAGWMVSPPRSKNSDTRLFIYWTTDNSKTGCYYHECPGFVQIHPNIGRGSRLVGSSIYGGQQRDMELAIYRDNRTGNWWLEYNGTDHIGYWPKAVLPQFKEGASLVAWGGLAVGPVNGDSPPMGNGHFPQGDFTKACYIQALSAMDSSNRFVSPDEDAMVSSMDNKMCYGLEYFGNEQKERGLSFLFGGPGGKCVV